MKICNECGYENNLGTLFCKSCGIKLEPPYNNQLKKDDDAPILEQNVAVDGSLKSTSFVTVYSIINIISVVFALICSNVSFFTMAFGIIALVYLNKAKKEINYEYFLVLKRNAIILNVTGSILFIVGFIAFMSTSIIYSFNL